MTAIGETPAAATATAKPNRARRRWPRRLTIAALALALVGAGGLWLRAKLAVDPLADLLIAEATIGDVVQAVEATGSLRPTQLVAVGAQVSGRITKMNAVIGKQLEAGDLIAEIDNVTQQNDLRTAEAALDDVRAQKRQKEATLAYAESALAREERTLAKEATSRDSWEVGESDRRDDARPDRLARGADQGSGRSRSTPRASSSAIPASPRRSAARCCSSRRRRGRTSTPFNRPRPSPCSDRSTACWCERKFRRPTRRR